MAVSLRNETLPAACCAEPGCINPLSQHDTGRPAIFCSAACRSRAHRRRHRHRAVSVEVQLGSTSSKNQTQGRVWMVCLRHGNDSLIVAIGMSRRDAERLAERMTDMVSSGD